MRKGQTLIYNICMAAAVGTFALLAALLPAGCDGMDCPLDNVVVMQCGLYTSETGEALSLADTLTIRPAGRDTVLVNRAIGTGTLLLPLRSRTGQDTLLFQLKSAAGQEAEDTVFITHSSSVHFEAVDCPASVFHNIESVRWTSHPLAELPLTIDSVSVVRTTVDYDDIENLKIFLRSTAH